MRLREISSLQNPWIKRLRAGLRRGELTEAGECAVEGFHLVEEALLSGLEVKAIVRTAASERYWQQLTPRLNGRERCFLTTERVFRSLAQTETSQGIAALVRMPHWDEKKVFARPHGVAAALVGLQDPGNLGTILRSLEAFGAAACLVGPGTVSPLNGKAMRASAGSVFRLPVFTHPTEKGLLAACRNHGLRTIALNAKARWALDELDLRGGFAFFVGREGSGLSRELLAAVDEVARIPIAPSVNSLNAAVAAALVLYEAARQRGFSF
ncbi:MAG: TrmH family RNA methyltransferase [Terriglobia bacterium]